MKTVVFSLGGSLVVPDNIDVAYLKKFKELITKLKKRFKIVIVTGGGKVAREYMAALRKVKLEEPYTSIVGIETTKLNAALVGGFIGQEHLVPNELKEVKKSLSKSNVVVCGAVGFMPEMTSDGDAAMIAAYLKASYFINLTNVDGLYTANPKVSKTAKLISSISFEDFALNVGRIKFKAGQHFVLDQSASKIINKERIPTAIINGKKIKEVENFLLGKKFKGTIIQ
jgi:uridylate kinase